MERLKLSIALDDRFEEGELQRIAEALGGAFDLKNRTYMLKASEESPPTAVFSFGEITGENIPYLLGVIRSDYWKKARKEISRILARRRDGEAPLVSFECSIGGVKANMRCRTSDQRSLEAAFEHLYSALDSLWTLAHNKNLPRSPSQIYLGYNEASKKYRIDRAVVLGTDFGEYEFDEKGGKWSKIASRQSDQRA
ncbi:hypothetical protein KEJ39_02945 [Candidatus Bathyarchaeota archaeon]|nr:hypothetical protein [Candidatus Bathyarchaeota archaeon]